MSLVKTNKGNNMPINDNGFSVRLTRIEEKIDKLSDVLISLARLEEKLLSSELNTTVAYQRIERQVERIDQLATRVTRVESSVGDTKKLIYILFTALATSFASQAIILYIIQQTFN